MRKIYRDFQHAVISAFQHYIVSSGRANRSEYWYFVLFSLLLNGFALFLDEKFQLIHRDQTGRETYILSTSIQCALLLPSLNLTIRRLHDINLSGWWLVILFGGTFVLGLFYAFSVQSATSPMVQQLLYYISLGGATLLALLFVVFMARKGTYGHNKFGPPPQ